LHAIQQHSIQPETDYHDKDVPEFAAALEELATLRGQRPTGPLRIRFIRYFRD